MTQLWVAGVDEAGRGPLAGPVVAAAVVLHPQRPIDGLRDSKQLAARRRETLFDTIIEHAHCYAIGEASPEEIDQFNILGATMTAMQRAVTGLRLRPALVRVDGNRAPDLGDLACETIIGGDALDVSISAASILAKVYRDRLMVEAHDTYPGYGFDRHKGYPTPEHLQALDALGPTPIHRRSFRPVRQTELF